MKPPLLRKSPFSLSVKFALAITLLVAGVAFTIGAVIVAQDWRRFHAELEEKVLLLARSVAVTAPEAILRNDYWALYRSLKKLAEPATGDIRATSVVTAMVLDPDGRVLAHLEPREHPLGLPLKPGNEDEARLLDAATSARAPTVLAGGGVGADGYLEGMIPLYSDEKTPRCRSRPSVHIWAFPQGKTLCVAGSRTDVWIGHRGKHFGGCDFP